MEAARQHQARQLQASCLVSSNFFCFCSFSNAFLLLLGKDQLQVQYTQLLPHSAAVEEFVRNYAQLSESVASTLHALPVQGACDERDLTDALQVKPSSIVW